ncbi:MAG TPA: hypothetical protein VH394_18855 [Thermoanaerobaculia bacterium]|jgi:hypothetical protein|nr:hypothetical protein [Thermoanaerobaculia bacterium]
MRRHRWLTGTVLIFLLAVPMAGAEKPSPILVSYSFDDGKTHTGPDTFSVFRNAGTNVQLSNAFRASGYQSVEIRDVAGDHDFPELQGYFPELRKGWLVIHFALLVTDPSEELNIALAGPGWFNLGRNGISFWLSTRDGDLLHTTDKVPKRLLRLRPFTWYGIDADYDIERGRYDLRIFEEGVKKPVVSLTGVPNANSLPGSAVSLFSFIGDLEDTSNVTYYVDDVVVATDRKIALPPFVAPGRRQFLADAQPSTPAVEGETVAARLERQGDAAFRERDLREAKRLYEEALKTTGDRAALLLKLSDVSFLMGDLAAEKALREKIYGNLDPRR